MAGPPAPVGRDGQRAAETDHEWLVNVADAAAAAADVPASLLGEYLTMLSSAALFGRRPSAFELTAVRDLGRRAAEDGVGADQAVNLYLSAAWRLWRELPRDVRSRSNQHVHEAAEAVLRVVDDAVEAFVGGHQTARRHLVRQEEALRRELIDDLLRGDADVAGLVQRAEPFGLDLGRGHQVALAASTTSAVLAASAGGVERAAVVVERAVVERFGDREVLVDTKEGNVVVLVPDTTVAREGREPSDVAGVVFAALSRRGDGSTWQVAAGRPHAGAYGIARSYEEARDALSLAQRLHLDAGPVDARDVLVYRVLGRDQAALVDLIDTVLSPLMHARGGAEPLLNTLHAYFSAGEVATAAAARLGISVRTVTYRLAKIKAVTGHDPADPDQRFALHAAVLGARLLDWPAQLLPSHS